jgi:predicted ATPase/DNA-binding SARP family transcriptional activator/Tfp pilus assembly protein PilF
MKGIRPVPALHIQLLGGFLVRDGGTPVTALDSPRLQALLATLLLHRHAPVPRQHLAFLLWPDSTEAQAQSNLRTLLHRLRRALPDADRFLDAELHALRWRLDAPFTLDVAEFERAVAQAEMAKRAGNERAARMAFEETIELYRGDLLPGCYDEWILPERERLRQMFVAALEQLIQLLENQRDYHAAIQAGQRLLRQDPLHEGTYRRLMRLHALSGDRASALRVYHTCAVVLARELGIEPSFATRATYDELARPEVPEAPTATRPITSTPAARSPRAWPNLPFPLTSFIGRARELAAVKQLLRRTRLLTLTGAAGCGKSRLALVVASDLAADYRDKTWLVELGALADEALLPQAVATVLEVLEEAQRPLAATLVDAIQARQMLLVLDNCEHLIIACAHLAQALLSACPQLQILATSREAFGIAGETTWVLPPLSLPDPQPLPSIDQLMQSEAIQLFVERAGAAMPTFTLTQENAAAVAQVCRRLDGIPLAIELAAARVKVLAVEQIAARLDDCFPLLAGGSRTALPRQQTLYAAIEWSYKLLADRERVLLRRLSVFAGGFAGFTIEAAEAVCAGPGLAAHEVLEVLAHLVDKSLVVVETQAGIVARYRLLETVRQYGREQLHAAGEAVEQQHAGFFLTLAEAAAPASRGEQLLAWLDRLEQEHDNLRAALVWSTTAGGNAEVGLRLAGALWWFWWVRGYWSEGRAWLERALAAGGGTPPTVQALALLGASWLAREQGDLVHAAAVAKESLTLYEEAGDIRGTADALHSLGWVARHQSDLEQAAVRLEESLRLSRALGDRRRIADALCGLGWVAEDQGDYGRQAALFEECLAHYREVSDRRGIPDALLGLGWVTFAQGDYEQAGRHFAESLALFRELGSKRDIAVVLNHLGEIARAQGEYEQAAASYNENLILSRQLGDKVAMGHVLHNLGHIAHRQGYDARAAAHFIESLGLWRAMGNKLGIAYCLAGLAGVAGTEGQPMRAAQLLGAVQSLLDAVSGALEPIDRLEYDRNVAGARAKLGEAAFAAAWAEGRAVPLEQVIAVALRVAAEVTSRE